MRARAAGVFAALLACLVYLNALHNPFVYDDEHTVVSNTSIEHLRDVRAIVLLDPTRPIVNLTYAIDRAVWGLKPLGFHITNVLLHALNVLLLFRLARRLGEDAGDGRSSTTTGRDIAAFSAAALLAVHPMMTEAVGYVSGRSEVLCATFFLTAVLSGRRWLRGEGRRWAAATVACWIAALASKETAAMLPFVLVAYDRLAVTGSENEKTDRLWTVHAPLVAVTLVAGLARLAVLAFIEYPGQISIHWSFVPLVLDVIRRYVSLLALPTGQTIFHEVAPVPWISVPAVIAYVGIAAGVLAAWRLRRHLWIATFGLLWFALLLLPQSVLTVLDRGEPIAEHRVYLASCGVFLAAGAGIGWLRSNLASIRQRVMAGVGLLLVLASFGAETLARNAVWRDPIDLWRESVELAPTHYRPRLLLGESLRDAGRRVEAVEEYRAAIARRPQDATGYAKLGLCLAELGRFDESEQAYQAIEKLDPQSPVSSNGLGTLSMLRGETNRARDYFKEAIARDPGNVPARQSLAILSELESKPAEALEVCQQIQQLAPRTPGVDDCVRRNQLRVRER